MPRITVEVNQAHTADAEALTKLLGQILTSSEFRFPGSWCSYCVVREHGTASQLYWCIGDTHDIAQAALVAAANHGHLGEEGKFGIRTVKCKPEIALA